VRGGAFGVEHGKGDVAEHDCRARVAGKAAEGLPIAGQFGGAGGEPGRAQVGVAAHAAKAGEVLERAAHAVVVEAVEVGASDFHDAPRVAGDGAGGDVAQAILPTPGRAQVDDRAEVEIDAERRQLAPLPLPVGARCGGRVLAVRQRGEWRQGVE